MIETTMRKSKTRSMAYIGLFVALIAICSWIAIPTTVPFTLQTFAVFLAVGLLGGKRGTLAVVVYLILGMIGLPVFANFQGGLGAVLGPSGGYLLGFVLTALVMWGMERVFGRGTLVLVLSMVLGLIVCYIVGTIWFLTAYTETAGAVAVGTVLGWCVFPFLLPDAVKIAAAVLVTKRLKKYVKD